MRIDVTKRLVRGKKITIEGGESRWVQLKYERLPNYCYRCGFLNHTLKDCSELSEKTAAGGDVEIQYGAWLRGEFVRRSNNDPSFSGPTKGGGTRSWETSAEAEKGQVGSQAHGNSKKEGKDHTPNLMTLEKNPLTRSDTSAKGLKHQLQCLHENGLVRELVRKQGEKETILSDNAVDQGKCQSGTKEKTGGESAADNKETSNLKLGMAQQNNTSVEDGPLSPRAESGQLL